MVDMRNVMPKATSIALRLYDLVCNLRLPVAHSHQ